MNPAPSSSASPPTPSRESLAAMPCYTSSCGRVTLYQGDALEVLPYPVIFPGLTGCVEATGHPTQKNVKLMNGSNINATFQKVNCKAVSEGMASGGF